jgi:hypothetical protein
LPVAATGHTDDLPAEYGSLPVDNKFDNEPDTTHKMRLRIRKGKFKFRIRATLCKKEGKTEETEVLGYVPIQAVHLSLEVDVRKRVLGLHHPYN